MLKTTFLSLTLAALAQTLGCEKKAPSSPPAQETPVAPKPVIAPAGMEKATDEQVILLARKQYSDLLKTVDYLKKARQTDCTPRFTEMEPAIVCYKSYVYTLGDEKK